MDQSSSSSQGVRALLFIGASVLAFPAASTEYFVDRDSLGGRCDDRHIGVSTSAPLCTLQACINRTVAPGDRCVLRSGNYIEPFTVSSQGALDRPIVFVSYTGEIAAIWGSDPIEESWQPDPWAEDILFIDATWPKPVELVEDRIDPRTGSRTRLRYGEYRGPSDSQISRPKTRGSRRGSGEAEALVAAPAGTWTWEDSGTGGRLRIHPAEIPDVSAANRMVGSAWRRVTRILDLSEARFVEFRAVRFWDLPLSGVRAGEHRFIGCSLEEGASAEAGEPAYDSGNSPVEEPFETSLPKSFAPDSGPAPGAGSDPSDPLAIEEGGTGGSSARAARANLGVPSTEDVVSLRGADLVEGDKTFRGNTRIRDLNGALVSTEYLGIDACVQDLPEAGGVCEIGPEEDDTLAFAETNPDLRNDALVIDRRGGGLRFLSSVREPGTDAWADAVPFVFQVRRNDPAGVYDGDPGWDGGWNCTLDYPGTIDEWRNCPEGPISGGVPGGSKSFWYTGQCNVNPASPHILCGGPQFFQIRYPEVPGEQSNKPILGVGSAGVTIHMPEKTNDYFSSALTIFRGEDSYWQPELRNTPMFSFDKMGLLADGGMYIGPTRGWPYPYSSHTYLPSILWVQTDLGNDFPAFVVEGTSEASEAAYTSPLAKFYDRSGKGSHEHPGTDLEAFGFYANSRLYLGSRRLDGLGESQLIEWEGATTDANTTKLLAAEPSAPRRIVLPDRDGYVAVVSGAADSPVVSPSAGVRVACGEVPVDPPGLSRGEAATITAAAPEVRAASACSCSPRADWLDAVVLKYCAVQTDGQVAFRFLNAGLSDLQDGDTPSQVVDYCCTAR